MNLLNLWLWSGLRIGPQLMDGLSAGRSPPRSKEEEEEDIQRSYCMRDANAAIAASVIETTHRPAFQVFFHQQHFLVHKQTSYTKH